MPRTAAIRPLCRRTARWDQLNFFYKKGLGYAIEMSNRPQTLYTLADSPGGLAAWMIDFAADSLEQRPALRLGFYGGFSFGLPAASFA